MHAGSRLAALPRSGEILMAFSPATGCRWLQQAAADTVDQPYPIEVKQQTNRDTADFEIGVELSLMHGQKRLHGFEFHHHRVLHHEVHAEVDIERIARVDDWQFLLSGIARFGAIEFPATRGFVYRFGPAWTECLMHLDGTANDAA